MNEYRLENNTFIIEDYDIQKPFASFLPGVAGLKGIPMWAYYTNRGQGIAGFGVENKNGAMMDFVPANVAYRRTELNGFRTFIKKEGKVHEIFSSISEDDYKRAMHIENNAVSFVERNETLNLEVRVRYFTATEEKYPALMRQVDFLPLNDSEMDVEVLDGLMTLWPYKNDNFVIKNMSNLAVAWFTVQGQEDNVLYYKNRSTTEDSASVSSVDAGHFFASYASFQEGPLPVIFDPDLIFGPYTGVLKPKSFEREDIDSLLAKKQIEANKLPCAFTAFNLKTNKAEKIVSVIGKMQHQDMLNDYKKVFSIDYFEEQNNKAQTLGKTLTADVESKTNFPNFDAYVKQSYLDNLLRGGYPVVLKKGDEPIVYHVYSRIHGDMEREYNDFYVEPAYYSHGNGNYRDVNQNRRNDVYFVKEAGLYNIKQFMELVQLDGQNPLTIQGSKLLLDEKNHDAILSYVKDKKEIIQEMIAKAFTPGAILTAIDVHDIQLTSSVDDFMTAILSQSTQTNEAAYGHGFWVDHWTYNMDLIDNYLNVYPENKEALVYDIPLRYFVSPDVVLKRQDKYVLNEQNQVRQYHAIYKDQERIDALKLSHSQANWQKTESHGIYQSNLFTKLLVLSLNKLSSFDPSGIGIMMNSDKPGWNDAMNGLPGLFGSGTSEVTELNRIVQFLKDNFNLYKRSISLPSSVADFLDVYLNEASKSSHEKWEVLQSAKEAFDEKNYYYVTDELVEINQDKIQLFLNKAEQTIEDSIQKAIALGHGVMVTFLVHDALEYQVLESKHPVLNLPNVKVTKWQVRPLPLFLEGPARYMKQVKDKTQAKSMFDLIKTSGLYDDKLKMYVTSASLEEESLEIGRARAFTAGWLERESNFMHMSYKYILSLLKCGLYEEYFEAVKTAMPPFMDPKVYGRSILENSSFIATSRNPDALNHGRGFVSRLTGTTSELISMWLYMMTGSKIFTYDQVLEFKLNPILNHGYFDENNEVSFNLFRDVKITYHNPLKKNTYGQDGVKPLSYDLYFKDGHKKSLACVTGEDAVAVRENKVDAIVVQLG